MTNLKKKCWPNKSKGYSPYARLDFQKHPCAWEAWSVLTPWHRRFTAVPCAAHTAGTGSASAWQACIQPEKSLQGYQGAGKSSLERPGGSQCPEGGRMGAEVVKGVPCPQPYQAVTLPPLTATPSRPCPARACPSCFIWGCTMGFLDQWATILTLTPIPPKSSVGLMFTAYTSTWIAHGHATKNHGLISVSFAPLYMHKNISSVCIKCICP